MNEINQLSDYAKNFSKFDRELHPEENMKDKIIFDHLNRNQTQRKFDVIVLDYWMNQHFYSLGIAYA
jgi:hypothetical protein